MSKKISLVLSGGGARGIAHIGVIEELEKHGFEITSIAGTSMGALIGGVYAMDRMDELKNWALSLGKRQIFSLIDFTFSSQGLIKGDKVLQAFRDLLPDMNIEDLRIPYSATATDILNRKEVVFTKGSLFDAIRASIAIPTVFTPVKTGNTMLLDGGIINNIPVNNVQRFAGDKLVVVDVNSDVAVYKPVLTEKESEKQENIYQKKIREFKEHLHKIIPSNTKEDKLGYFSLIEKTFNLMRQQMASLLLQQYNPDLLIEISRHTCNPFDFFKVEELIETGRCVARQSIENKQYL